MPYSLVRFPVQAAKPWDEVNLALRISAAFELRHLFRRKIAAATAAGASKQDACHKLGFLLQSARKASRFTRNIAPALLQWCGQVEYHRGEGEYPAPADESVGTFNAHCLSLLPANVVMIDIGGLNLIGTSDQPINMAEVAEVRIERVPVEATGEDSFFCAVVSGRPEGGPGEALPEPQPHEEIDA